MEEDTEEAEEEDGDLVVEEEETPPATTTTPPATTTTPPATTTTDIPDPATYVLAPVNTDPLRGFIGTTLPTQALVEMHTSLMVVVYCDRAILGICK